MSFEFQTPIVAMDPLATLQRKPEIRSASPGQYVKQRIAEAASRLSRAGQMAAHVELCNEALHHLVHLAYQADDDHLPANVDRVDFRLLIPCPWGAKGWRQWGLRKWEGAILRHIMLNRQAGHRQAIPLFVHDHEAKTWHLNYHDYNDIALASAYLKRHPVTLSEWRLYAEQYRERVATRRRQYPRRGR